VHESILTSRSEYFKCDLGSMWRNDPTKPVTLSDDDPDVFALYVNLVYTGRLATRGTNEWLKLVRLYVLAEKLQDVHAKNDTFDAMNAFIREFSWIRIFSSAPGDATNLPLISAESIAELYDGTPALSPARGLVLDSCAEMDRGDWLTVGRGVLPVDFVYDLAVTVMRKRPFKKSETTPKIVRVNLPKSEGETAPLSAVDT
jgi:hypothetical protein